MRYKFLLILPVAVLVVLLTVYGRTEKSDMMTETPDRQSALRLIGHRLLLSAGDSHSRVMPVKELSANEFQIRFEGPLSLQPDSIINIISSVIKTTSLPDNYTANVLSCVQNEVMHSFSIFKNSDNNIVPCLGRTLPKACYYINIRFVTPKAAWSNTGRLLAGGLLVLLLSAYLLYAWLKKKKTIAAPQKEEPTVHNGIAIGHFLFYADQQYLQINGERTELTDKEAKLLSIFALAPNEMIGREQLQKEVWENEGVIVTRSLDVFISRLRKKLEKDPGVKLVNVHGKGYKLEVLS